MRNLFFVSGILLALSCGNACAEPDPQSFTGAKIGVEVSRVRDSLRGDPGNIGASNVIAKNGAGYRSFVGYDMQLGSAFVIGAEAGIGGGAKSVTQKGPAGTYTVDPGLTYDLSARAGFVPTQGLLLYGRAGYRWLQTKEVTTPAATNAAVVSTKQTERAWTYGVGAEIQVTPSLSLRAEYNRTPYSKNFKANAFAIGGAFRF